MCILYMYICMRIYILSVVYIINYTLSFQFGDVRLCVHN